MNEPTKCNACGACCRSGWGIPAGASWFKQWVVISPEDKARISKHFGMSEDEFCKKYGIEENQLDITGGECPFLNNNLCSIHEIKPHFCAITKACGNG